MVIYDFSQYIPQRLVRGFRQAVRLRVVWRALLVDDRVIVCEPVDDLIEEMGPWSLISSMGHLKRHQMCSYRNLIVEVVVLPLRGLASTHFVQ